MYTVNGINQNFEKEKWTTHKDVIQIRYGVKYLEIGKFGSFLLILVNSTAEEHRGKETTNDRRLTASMKGQ